MLSNISFEYPIAFVLIIIYLLCLKYCKQKVVSIFFPNVAFLKEATRNTRVFIKVLKILLVLSLITALASPIKEDSIVVDKSQGYEISLIIDASGSMNQSNKFNIVKQLVNNFIDSRKNDKLALSIFADFAYVAVPLTYDKKSIKRLLSKINVGVAGMRKTALYEALFLSSNLFKASKSKERIAILMTDGMDNTNTIPMNVAIKTAKKYNIKVYTIGIGRDGDFNFDVLQQIADETNARAFQSNSIEGLKNIYKTIDKLEKSKIVTNKYIKKTYYFQYVLVFALFLFSILFYVRNRR